MRTTTTKRFLGSAAPVGLLFCVMAAIAVSVIFSLAVGISAAYANEPAINHDGKNYALNSENTPVSTVQNNRGDAGAAGVSVFANVTTTPVSADAPAAAAPSNDVSRASDSAEKVQAASPSTAVQNNQSEPAVAAQNIVSAPENDPVATVNGVFYYSFDEAFSSIAEGGVLNMYSSVERSTPLLVDRSMTINGNGYTLSSTANRVIRVTNPNVNLTLNDLKVESRCTASSDVRGISLDNAASGAVLNLNDSTVSASFYAINVVPGAENIQVNINNGSVAAGWAAINTYSSNSVYNIVNSELIGINSTSSNSWNNFHTICFDGNALYNTDNIGVYGSGNIVNIRGSKVEASTESDNNQNWIGVQYGACNNVVTVDASSSLVDAEENDVSEALLLGWYAGYTGEGWTYYSGNNQVIIWSDADRFTIVTGYTLDAEDNEMTRDVLLPNLALTREGWIFGGWTPDEEGDESVVAGGKYTMPAEYASVSFSANWLRDISADEVTVDDIEAVDYDGSEQEPALTIRDAEKLLEAGVDYDVAYTGNLNPGEATATITGKGAYAGTRNVVFIIREMPPEQESNGVIAEGEIFESASHDGYVVVLDVEDVTDLAVVDLTETALELASEYVAEVESGKLLEFKVFSVNLMLRDRTTGEEDSMTDDFGTLTLKFRLASDDSLDGYTVRVTQVHIDEAGAAVTIVHDPAVIQNGMVTVVVDCLSEFILGVESPDAPEAADSTGTDALVVSDSAETETNDSGNPGEPANSDNTTVTGGDEAAVSSDETASEALDGPEMADESPKATEEPSKVPESFEVDYVKAAPATARLAPSDVQLPKTCDNSSAVIVLALAAMLAAAIALTIQRREFM